MTATHIYRCTKSILISKLRIHIQDYYKNLAVISFLINLLDGWVQVFL